MDEILSQTKVNTFFNVTIYVIDFVTIVLFLRIYIFQKQLPVDVFKISVFLKILQYSKENTHAGVSF